MSSTKLLTFAYALAILCLSLLLCCSEDDGSTGPGPTIPVLTTSSVSNITETSAECGGNITSDGGAAVTARGVCWCTGQTPIMTDDTTNDGTGTGAFTSAITGLTQATTYYVRAYAINSAGVGYGGIDSITTAIYGTVIIDASPDSLNAPWSLSGPESYSTSGTGDDTLTNLKAGNYTVSWGEVSGWRTPPDSSQTLMAGGTITLAGTYIETGIIIIDASPDSLNAPWSLTGPGGYSANGTGDDTLADMSLGDYTVTWSTVSGWRTPSDETQTLIFDDTVTFNGCYVETGTMTDYDGNSYVTVKIGDQWWMMENLKVTHYRNGDVIPKVTDAITWSGLSTGAHCSYDNNDSHIATYGRLYNWYAVNDTRNIAPTGWHVPADADWKQLEMYLGMSQSEADATSDRGTDEGGKLKEAGTAHWDSPNRGATNESGFTALPASLRYSDGDFNPWLGWSTVFWSATENSSNYAWYRSLDYYKSTVCRNTVDKRDGLSIRCVKD